MAEVWVRLPLGALDFRMWESLAFRVFREHEIAGSNPAVLTELMRWGPCWYGQAAVNRPDAGSIPAAAAFDKRKGKPTGDGSRARKRSSVTALRVRLPLLPLDNNVLLAERQRLQASNLARRVRLPQGTLGDPGSSLLVVMPGFEPGVRRFDSCPRSFVRTMHAHDVSSDR